MSGTPWLNFSSFCEAEPEPVEESPKNVGRKDDQGKLSWDLLPFSATEQVLKVLMHGAKRYGEFDWKLVDDGERRYWNAAMRHLIAYQQGETLDPDSGLPHLAHAACSVLFALELSES